MTRRRTYQKSAWNLISLHVSWRGRRWTTILCRRPVHPRKGPLRDRLGDRDPHREQRSRNTTRTGRSLLHEPLPNRHKQRLPLRLRLPLRTRGTLTTPTRPRPRRTRETSLWTPQTWPRELWPRLEHLCDPQRQDGPQRSKATHGNISSL